MSRSAPLLVLADDAPPATPGERTPAVPVRALPKSPETPPDVEEMYAELIDAVGFLAVAGRPTPCSGEDSADWTSDDPERQMRAADRCHDCPLMFACRSYADAAKETAGTWGGKTRRTVEDVRARAAYLQGSQSGNAPTGPPGHPATGGPRSPATASVGAVAGRGWPVPPRARLTAPSAAVPGGRRRHARAGRGAR